jgi:hypothetical protein
MKNLITTQFHTDDLMLTACIWYAQIDFTSLADYALKAIIGGVVWFGFKLATDYITEKFKNKD